MPALKYELLRLKKRVPLTISRGTSTHTEVFWLRWEEDGAEGWGEAVPFAIDEYPQTLAMVVAAFEEHRGWLERAAGVDRLRIEQQLWERRAPSAFIAAVNQALYDWLGKRSHLPVSQLLGFGPGPGCVTSVTVGIGTPESAIRRVRQWLEVGEVRAFKIKLGAPAGIEADKAMFAAVKSAVPAQARLSVDANGGWTLAGAIEMSRWLAGHEVDHIEQPLACGKEDDLPALQTASPLPVLVDESCRTSEDIPKLAGRVAGINIKLMKCGGLDGALRLVHTARAHGLRILVGCYGNSTLGNTCALALAPLVDYLDLDSHLNLEADPFKGAVLQEGRLVSHSSPGFGISHP
ncbi:MAG: dipeptide epimerase [Opitutus sp.]|nr:dipeptide epimerase [Opitutus sp.]